MNPAGIAQLLLMYGVAPLWIAAGIVDWSCHRRTGIERTSGLRENIFHWVLFAEGGVALLAAALLEVNAAVLVVVLAAFVAHELTTYVELRYTARRREIRPFEQMVHSFMELLPLMLLALLAVIARDDVAAVFGEGSADLGLRWKEQPWPVGYLLGASAGVVLLNVLPLAEETRRCLRGGR